MSRQPAKEEEGERDVTHAAALLTYQIANNLTPQLEHAACALNNTCREHVRKQPASFGRHHLSRNRRCTPQ